MRWFSQTALMLWVVGLGLVGLLGRWEKGFSVDENAIATRHVYEEFRERDWHKVVDGGVSRKMVTRQKMRQLVSEELLMYTFDSTIGNATIDYAIQTSKQGSGMHSIALVFPYCDNSRQYSLGIDTSLYLIKYLRYSEWRAKEFIYVFVPVPQCDDMEKASEILREWLNMYHSDFSSSFRRSGSIDQALVFILDEPFDGVSVNTIGRFGLLSNMDLLSLASFYSKKFSLPFTFASTFSNNLPVYLQELPFANFMYSQLQALWSPGFNGEFGEYHIDSIVFQTTFEKQEIPVQNMLKFISCVLRCLNGLVERFHHSNFLYLVSGTSNYIPLSIFIYPLVLPIAGIAIKGLQIYFDELFLHSLNSSFTLAVISVSSLLFVLLCNHFPTHGREMLSALVVIILSSRVFFKSPNKNQHEWKSLKFYSLFTFLCCSVPLGLLNFTLGFVNNLLLVPMLIICHPLQHSTIFSTTIQIFLFLGNLFLIQLCLSQYHTNIPMLPTVLFLSMYMSSLYVFLFG